MKKFSPEAAVLAAGLAVGSAGCESLPKVSLDFSRPPDSAEVLRRGKQIDEYLLLVGQGETETNDQLLSIAILENYLEIMGNSEARRRYRNSIVNTAETLKEKGDIDLSWRLLRDLETAGDAEIRILTEEWK